MTKKKKLFKCKKKKSQRLKRNTKINKKRNKKRNKNRNKNRNKKRNKKRKPTNSDVSVLINTKNYLPKVFFMAIVMLIFGIKGPC